MEFFMKLSKVSSVIIAMVVPFLFTAQVAVAGPNKAAMNKDGEIIAYVIALDNHEIKASDEATQKKVNSAVTDYAKMLHDDHEKNLKQANDLSESIKVPANQTKSIVQFEKKGEKDLSSMSKMDGLKFQKAFLKAMVKGHEAALTKINGYL